MKRIKVIILTVLVALLFSSCEIAFDKATKPGDVWYIGFGADFQRISGASRLYYTVKDAIEVGKAFEALADKAGMGFKDIYFLNDDRLEKTGDPDVHDCTWEDYQYYISQEIHPKANDIVICFFSGHGQVDHGNDNGYGSTDSFKNNGISFYSKYNASKSNEVSFESVYNFIDKMEGSHFIICDTCYSGSMVKPDGVSVDRNSYKNYPPIKLLFQDMVDQSSKTWVLAACTLKQESTELRWDPMDFSQGGLTYFVLKGLGWDVNNQRLGNVLAQDGLFVSAGSISRYVYKNGGSYTLVSNHQDPVFGAGSSDLILFKF